MVIKVYISGISGNKEVKKRQQRVLMILDSKSIKYEVVDIAEPNSEDAKEFMQNNATSLGATVGDMNPRSPLPPQIFNDTDYCGDYDQFDLANEVDEIEKFLKIEQSSVVSEAKLGNGDVKSDAKPAADDVAEVNNANAPESEGKVADEEKIENGSPEGDGTGEENEA